MCTASIEYQEASGDEFSTFHLFVPAIHYKIQNNQKAAIVTNCSYFI